MTRQLLPVLFSAFLLLIGTSACSPPDRAVPLVNPDWIVQYQDTTSLFIGISIVDEQTVWVSGTGGRYGRTTDGGQTWEIQTVPGTDSLQFRDVKAFDADSAFLLSIGSGDQSRIYRTGDGGRTWDLSFQNDNPNAFFDCIDFWDRDRGFAFSDSHEGEFILIRTLDGGATWSRIPPENVPDARRPRSRGRPGRRRPRRTAGGRAPRGPCRPPR